MSSDEDLHPYVSELAAHVLAISPTDGWIELDGTLAFFDISGFTTLTRRLAGFGRAGAELINDVVTVVFRRLIEEVFRFGGDVLEFGGDAMFVRYSGTGHQRRAAAAAACMFRALEGVGPVPTPVGTVRVRMSCGMATGSQPYYLVGSTRKALVVAGPVSSAMALLEADAGRGEVLISDALASALPHPWVQRRRRDGRSRLCLDAVEGVSPATDARRRRPETVDASPLLPVEFRALSNIGHRDGELKQVAMSFIRFDGTDALLATRGAGAVHERLRAITELVDETAAKRNVCWLETQVEANGVRWTLTAGAPTATERDGERMLRVLREITDSTPSPLRIGANLGVVFTGELGHPRRCTYTVIGDATNVAARLMSRADPGLVIAGEPLLETCREAFDTRALEPFKVKGLDEPVRAHVVGDLAASRDPMGTDGADRGTPMIGRAGELSRLIGAIENGGVIEVVGDAGVGKTKLWTEARALTPSRRWTIVRAEPHETSAPYAPIARLLRRAAGIDVRASAAAGGQALAQLVGRLAPEEVRWLPLIADVAGVAVEPSAAVDGLNAAFRADRQRIAVAELVLAIAGPDAVLLIEDADWLDDASGALVSAIARLLGERAALVLVRRANLPTGFEGRVVIEVGPIAAASADELVLRELPPNLASDATLARLRDTAGGNPLFLIELARAAAAGAPRAGGSLPGSIERLIAARIDRLPAAGRELIRDAAVLGSTFPRLLSALVIEREELNEVTSWERELGDLVVVDGEHVRFSHDMVRVAAYEGLSLRRRRAVHRRACEVIEARRDTLPLADPIATLAFHAAGAGSPALVVKWTGAAAEAAAARGAMEIAERHLAEVVAAEGVTGATEAARCATLRLLATAAERAGHLDVALSALASAGALTEGDERAQLVVDRARVLEKLGRYRASLLITARALKANPAPSLAGHLLLARATVRNYLGEWKACLRITNDLLATVDDRDDPRLCARAHLLSEWCCSCLGLPERAAHELAALQLLTELDDSVGLGNLFLNRGVSAWRECRVDDAIADFRASADHYRRAGDVMGAAMADNNLAEIFTLQFHLDPAEQLLRNAIRVTRAANYPHGEMTALSGLSRVVAWRGEVAEALDLQSTALTGFHELAADDYVLDSMVRMVELLVLAGDQAGALTAAEDAAALLAKLGPVPMVPATLERLCGWALQRAGRSQAAIDSLEHARSLAADEGFTYEVAICTLMLGRLQGDPARVRRGVAQLRRLGVHEMPPCCREATIGE